jgi:hypothetical protein
MLGIDVVPVAGAGQAAEERRSLADTMSAVARDFIRGNGVTRVVSLSRRLSTMTVNR